MTSLYAPPWSPALGTADEHDLTSGDPREWGVDVALPAGTPIYAPFSGYLSGYQPSSTDWEPGRLVETGGPSGESVAFGHVVDLVAPGSRVQAGQEIGVVGNLGGNSHTEFMLAPGGGTLGSKSAVTDPRSYLAQLFGGGGQQAQLASFGFNSHNLVSPVNALPGGIFLPGGVLNSDGKTTDLTGGIAGGLAGDIAGAAAGAAASAFGAVFSTAGHGIVNAGSALTHNIGEWGKAHALGLFVAAVVIVVLFGTQGMAQA